MISRNSSHFSLSPAVSEECDGEEEEGEAALRPAAAVGETRAERLALSGLYLNSSDALKYLTDQLSWVGLRKGGDGGDGNKEDGEVDASPDMKPEAVESPRDEKNQIPGKNHAVSFSKMTREFIKVVGIVNENFALLDFLWVDLDLVSEFSDVVHRQRNVFTLFTVDIVAY